MRARHQHLPWLQPARGHTGVCGRVSGDETAAQDDWPRPRVAKFPERAHAIIAIYDDSTTRVWWLRSGKWAPEASILEALWQVSFETKGAFEVVTPEARIGAAHVRYDRHLPRQKRRWRACCAPPKPDR